MTTPAYRPLTFNPPLSEPGALEGLAQSIRFPVVPQPMVSVVMCGRDRPDLTLTALKALAERTPPDMLEVIFVDDASSQETRGLLAQVEGLRLVLNDDNLGFLLSTNRGIEAATGEHVLLLNNDTEVQDGWLAPLLELMDDPTVGAVGCRLINADGTVQEAGVAVWDDGGGHALCSGGDPGDERWLSTREVDYASGAALLVRGSLVRDLGGLDDRYAPAFYEDTDLCFAVRDRGFRVLLAPESSVLHHGGSTYGRDAKKPGSLPSRGKMHQYANQPIFSAKWAKQLASDHMPPGSESSRVPFRGRWRPRILVADSWVPADDRDAGGLRMTWIVRLLHRMGCDVTLWATGDEPRDAYAARLRREGIEVWTGRRGRRFLRSRPGSYDIAFVSRPDVATEVIPLVRSTSPRAVVIYDSVDVHFQRLRREEEVTGAQTTIGWQRMLEMEERVCAQADLVTVVSDADAAEFATAFSGLDLTFRVVSTVFPEWPTSPQPPFHDRHGFIFIGGYGHPPNRDAAMWFVEEILPRIRTRLDAPVAFLGDAPPPELTHFDDGAGVLVPGYVPDVVPWFDRARVFICPLRYGSGVKGKINQALSAAVPVVATSVSVEGMDLADGVDVWLRDDPESFADACVELHENSAEWARMSAAAAAASATWSVPALNSALEALLNEVLPPLARYRLARHG